MFVAVVQSLSCFQLFMTPWTAACQPSLSFTVSQSLLRLIPTVSMMLSNHFIFCCPLSTCPQPFPAPGFFPIISFFRIRWPKYWSFSFSISLSIEYSGLISFKDDCFDLLEAQGTLKRLLQHHNSKTSILLQ